MIERKVTPRILAVIDRISTVERYGRVRRIMPTYIEASGPDVPLGTLCRVGSSLMAEVIRVDADGVTLAAYGAPDSLSLGDRVTALEEGGMVRTGPAVLGRAMDPLGRPVDGLGSLRRLEATWPLSGRETNPLDKVSPNTVFETKIRCIDSLLTLGVGQRVGIFAGSGVGKTSLLSSLTRHSGSDVSVLCMVGERGREAHDLWSAGIGPERRASSVMVVATSDQSAMMRARAVWCALAHAEYFRSQGKHVLLVVDSMTRFALALREIGLAAGEPPTVRAYTPGVFSALPKAVERCGAVQGQGAITAVMTVLTETDEVDDPMAETMRALLDGHIVLSRKLAEQAHYPAIDVPRSISRVFKRVTSERDRIIAADAIAQLALYDASRILIESGIHQPGSQPALDRALTLRPELLSFLKQDADHPVARSDGLQALDRLVRST